MTTPAASCTSNGRMPSIRWMATRARGRTPRGAACRGSTCRGPCRGARMLPCEHVLVGERRGTASPSSGSRGRAGRPGRAAASTAAPTTARTRLTGRGPSRPGTFSIFRCGCVTRSAGEVHGPRTCVSGSCHRDSSERQGDSRNLPSGRRHGVGDRRLVRRAAAIRLGPPRTNTDRSVPTDLSQERPTCPTDPAPKHPVRRAHRARAARGPPRRPRPTAGTDEYVTADQGDGRQARSATRPAAATSSCSPPPSRSCGTASRCSPRTAAGAR